MKAIRKVLGEDKIEVVAGTDAGQAEIAVLDADNVIRPDLRIVFIIATTHEEPVVIKKKYGWMRYIDLERLVACGWIPALHKAGIAGANSAA